MTSRWSDEVLAAARHHADPPADNFMAGVLREAAAAAGAQANRLSYNQLLDIATALVESPGLSLVCGWKGLNGEAVEASELRKRLDQASSMAYVFNPVRAPAWLDEKKLAMASEIWNTDSLLVLIILYAASLPACYLMKAGVPVLYSTEKLKEQTYIFQRIYETGLMLEQVLMPGGISVMHDTKRDGDPAIVDALNRRDPHGDWAFGADGMLVRRSQAAAPDAETLKQMIYEARSTHYIWGSGLVSAQKVRFLHSALRFMLQNPNPHAAGTGEPSRSYIDQVSKRAQAWDEAALGKPINQEDLAFVLLTFGYLIPRGFEVWGRKVSREEKEAFLHLWRVVGYVMGVREDLMTDDLDEARELYERILKRNAGTTEEGTILMAAVMEFFGDYLTPRFGLRENVPAMMVIDQLGREHARMVLPETSYTQATRVIPNMLHAIVRILVRMGFWVDRNILSHLPVAGPGVATMTQQAADAFIDSWRDSFRRKPFYVAAGPTSWKLLPGATKEYRQSLQLWREQLFNTIAVGIAALIVSGLGALATIVFFALDNEVLDFSYRITPRIFWSFLVGAVGFWGSNFFLRTRMAAVARERPLIERTATSPSANAASAPAQPVSAA